MSKRSAFEAFKPSYLTLGYGWPPVLFEEAFRHGAAQLSPRLDVEAGASFEAEGVVGAGVQRSLRFGHLPVGNANLPAELSGAAPYRMTVSFDGKDQLKSVKLVVFLLNPRAILTETLFIPARLAPDGQYIALTAGVAPVGLLLVADPNASATERFEALSDGLPDTGPTPPNMQHFSDNTLLSRLDLSIEWKDDFLGAKSADLFGRAIGVPDGSLPAAIPFWTVGLFSPDLPQPIEHILDKTKTFGFDLVHDVTDGVHIITGRPADPQTRSLLFKATAEFNLPNDFRGWLFEGLRVQWLDDQQCGRANVPTVGLSLTAVSFGGGDPKPQSKWYTSLEIKLPPAEKEGYLKLFDNVTLLLSIAEDDITQASLRGVFTELDSPYAWLAGRTAVLSWRAETWTDDRNQKHDFAAFDLGLEAEGKDVLKVLTPDDPVKVDPDVFSALAVGLTLAPIVLATNPPKTPDNVHAPDAKTRGYFVTVRDEVGLAQLYAAMALGWFFKHAVRIEQLRIVGARLQRQPAAINFPTRNVKEYQTALLFDYEADYQITVEDADIKTTSFLTTRIDGTGITFDSGRVYWVQVPNGIRELAIADPSLWELGALGKFLKVVDMTVRRSPYKQLVIRLRLMGNTDIITAGDFVFIIPLEGDQRPEIEAFPSEVTVDIPEVVKGTGTLIISKTPEGRDVAGSLDLTFPTGFRLFGAVRVARAVQPDGGTATASLYSTKVTFATPIPVFGTGLGWTGIDAVMATHFKRVEPPPQPGFPPALAWLQQAGGDVATSIKGPNLALWGVEHDRTSIGIGVTLALSVSSDLLNLNAMLMVERPGPRILIFAKANLVEKPKKNEEASNDLRRGILGVLDLDRAKDELTFSAQADVEFKDLVSLRVPLELYFDLHHGRRWHLHLGTFLRPANAVLKLFGVATTTATGFLMADGEEIAGFPSGRGQKTTLPGFAVALGMGAEFKIGNNSLYARGALNTYFGASIYHGVYVSGYIELRGELNLYIVTIAAHASLLTEYLLDEDGTVQISISGEIYGRIKTFFIDIEGRITIRIGSDVEDERPFPALTERASLVSGTDVALRGQGRVGPIDAVLAEAVAVGGPEPIPENVPLDAVVAVAVAQPPRIHASPEGFARTAPVFNQNETLFNLGNRKGEYVLKSVRLRRRHGGGWQDVDYPRCPARWWTSGQASKAGQPSSKTLALLTRDPLGAKNVVVSPEQLQVWLDSIVGGVCDPTLDPQLCWYALASVDAGVPADGRWRVAAALRDTSTEVEIGRSGASDSQIELEERDGYGEAADPLAGFPRFIGSCQVETDAQLGLPVAILSLYSRIVAGVRVHSKAILHGEMWPQVPLELLIAHAPLPRSDFLLFFFKTSAGRELALSYRDLIQGGHVADLADPQVRAAFHQGAAHWEPPTESFARLGQLPRYFGFEFRRLRIDLPTLGLAADEYPVSLRIFLSNEVSAADDMLVILGGYRFVPIAEKRRYDNDVRHKQATLDGLNDFLRGDPIPLLEPDSVYQVLIGWHSVLNGNALPLETRQFEFKTTSHPPRSIIPYLLATFPQAKERFHCVTDMPGFGLGSTDALRILAQFPDARLRFTITDDSGEAVTDAHNTLRWDRGVIVAPRDFLDPVAPVPSGFIKDSIASLPSALRNAIYERMREGLLQCVGPINFPEGGIWIGFDVSLRALSGYRIAIDIVRPDGTLWPWPADASIPSAPFLEWTFSTALHRDLVSHVSALSEGRPRHRVLKKALDERFVLAGESHLSEKVFEDLLAEALDERSDRSGDLRLTVLWAKDGAGLTASGLLVESREPLYRTTRSVRVGLLSETAPETTVAETANLLLQSVDLQRTLRVSGLTYSTSGCALLARIDHQAQGNLRLLFARHLVERIPVAQAGVAPLEVSAAILAPRPVREA